MAVLPEYATPRRPSRLGWLLAAALGLALALLPGGRGVEVTWGKRSLGYYPLDWRWGTLTGCGPASTTQTNFYGPIHISQTWP